MNNIIYNINNKRWGLESTVRTMNDGRIGVTLKDTDADKTLDAMVIYPAHMKAQAIEYANKLCA